MLSEAIARLEDNSRYRLPWLSGLFSFLIGFTCYASLSFIPPAVVEEMVPLETLRTLIREYDTILDTEISESKVEAHALAQSSLCHPQA